jgi:hypothetical protein
MRFLAALLLMAVMLSPASAVADWAFTDAYHLPPAPDHEHKTTFYAAVRYINDTAAMNSSNGTGTNGTGTNGTGTNGTGTNGTGINLTVNVTSCHMVIEPQDNRSIGPIARLNMTQEGAPDDFRLTLGPWPPGAEILYHYEANLSNGTVIRSNSSWVRTPDLLTVGWHYSLDEAIRIARELGRPLLVLVFSGFAQTTRQLDEKVFARPGVIRSSAGFVCLRIDNETSPGFSLEHGLRRLPAIVFVNATTGNETARLENPFDGSWVENEMQYLLGNGEKPTVAIWNGPQYRIEAIALGSVLVAGPVVVFLLLRFAKHRAF